MRLVGDLVRVRSGGKSTPPPALVVQGEMIEELRRPESQTTPMTAMLQLPSAGATTTELVALPALPADWIEARSRTLQVAVQDGPTVVAKDVRVPCRVELTLRQRRCVLSATPIKGKDGKDQVRLDLADTSGRINAN